MDVGRAGIQTAFDRLDSGISITARMAFAALIIREELRLSDRETVEQISENPYLQFFAGNMKLCAGAERRRQDELDRIPIEGKFGRGSADSDGLGSWRNSPKRQDCDWHESAGHESGLWKGGFLFSFYLSVWKWVIRERREQERIWREVPDMG